MSEPEDITVIYRNYRGEVAPRRIRPLRIELKATEWHPEPQWIMRAFDLDKEVWRDFALRDMAPLDALADARREGERAGIEKAAKVAEQFTASDWIAHDMRTGVFPQQGEPGKAIAAAIRAEKERQP